MTKMAKAITSFLVRYYTGYTMHYYYCSVVRFDFISHPPQNSPYVEYAYTFSFHIMEQSEYM